EDLGGLAGRPGDFQLRDPVGFADADVLFERVGAEAAAARHPTINGPGVLPRGHDLDARADAGAVGFRADQLHANPMIAVAAGILKQRAAEGVARHRAAEVDEQVHVAVAVPVAHTD